MRQTAHHYATLNVSPDAPKEVIDAAYRALSKKYHPDLNRNDPAAAARMAQINAAYDVLSDPLKRYPYDKQLQTDAARAVQLRQAATIKPFGRQKPIKNASSSFSLFSFRRARPPLRRLLWSIARPLLIVAFLMLYFIPNGAHMMKNAMTGGPLRSSMYHRPATAPNGENWPHNAAYILGYAVQAMSGQANVTIDNKDGDHDAFIKLLSDDAVPKTLRVFYVPAARDFALHTLQAGSYRLQYRDLTTGLLYTSASFAVKDGAESSNLLIKLR